MTTYDNHVYMTVDIVLIAYHNTTPHVLLIRRSNRSDAYPNYWALPGGYLDKNERLEGAARRELFEETSIIAPAKWHRIGIYDNPKRDPRGRVFSVAYAAVLPHMPEPKAGDDAHEAQWFMLRVTPKDLAFDHNEILADAYRQLRDPLRWASR